MPSLRNLLLLGLALSLVLNVGCVSAAGSHLAGGDQASATQCLDHSDHGDLEAAEIGHHGAARAGLYAFAGLAIVTVALVDVLLLPFTYRRPFPCCRGVLSICH